MQRLRESYGPWALVTGASAGIGAEFARQLAAAGLNLVLVARREPVLDRLAADLRGRHGIDARVIAADLTAPGFLDDLRAGTAELDIGLLVNNAGAYMPGAFLDRSLEEEVALVDLNVRAPLILAHEFGRRFVARGRGGIVFLASTAAYQGTPYLANYSATKAYDLHLAEALAHELAPHKVDVLAIAPGPTATEGTDPIDLSALPAKPMAAAAVVAKALRKLGRTHTTIPGGLNNVVHALVGRVLPRRINSKLAGNLFARIARDTEKHRRA